MKRLLKLLKIFFNVLNYALKFDKIADMKDINKLCYVDYYCLHLVDTNDYFCIVFQSSPFFPVYVNPSHIPPLSESTRESGELFTFYLVKVSSIYRTSVLDWSLGLKGGLICLVIIMSQSTPANQGCYITSIPSFGPPPSLSSGLATNSFYMYMIKETRN